MLASEEKLWQELNKYYVFKMDLYIEKERKKLDHYVENINGEFVEKEGYIKVGRIIRKVSNPYYPFWISPHHLNFTYGINRATIYYPKIIKVELAEDFINYENSLYFDTILLFLINALENYLVDTFKYIAEGVEVLHVNRKELKRFLRIFNLNRDFLGFTKKSNFLLSELIPERIDMQQKKKCKTAYKLLGINLTDLNPEIWENIYTNKPVGYMKRRHKIVHSSFQSEMNNINEVNIESEIAYIEKTLLDIAKFVHDLEWIRLRFRPDPMEVHWVENVLGLDYVPRDFQEFKEGIIDGFKSLKKRNNKKD